MNKVSTADYSWKDLTEVWLNQCWKRDKLSMCLDTGKRCEEELYDFKLYIVGYECIPIHHLWYKKEIEDYIDYLNKRKEEGQLKIVDVEWQKDNYVKVTINNGYCKTWQRPKEKTPRTDQEFEQWWKEFKEGQND